MDNTIELFNDLYASEINWEIKTFWDIGYSASFGDESNGFTASVDANTMTEAVEALKNMAIEYYPDSEFAQKYT